MTPRFLSINDVAILSRDLANQVSERPDLLVGIANGAVLPTKIMADQLGLPYHIVRVRRRLSRYKDIAYRVMNALHIPVSIIHWSPLYWVFYILHRPKLSIDLEQDDKTFDFPVAGKHVLIVDDVLLTGNSVAYVRNRLLRNGAASVAVAVLHYVGEVVPDYYLSQTDGLWWFPWSYNSPYRHEYMGWLTANGLAR